MEKIGLFETKETCVSFLKNKGFIQHSENVYINKSKYDVAEIYIYKDNSASVLIGKYSTLKLVSNENE